MSENEIKDNLTDKEFNDLTHAIVNTTAYEYVNHPAHYGNENNPYECVKIAEALGWDKDAYKFTAFRYLYRSGTKPGNPEEQDLRKAIWYLQRKLKNLTGEN